MLAEKVGKASNWSEIKTGAPSKQGKAWLQVIDSERDGVGKNKDGKNQAQDGGWDKNWGTEEEDRMWDGEVRKQITLHKIKLQISRTEDSAGKNPSGVLNKKG